MDVISSFLVWSLPVAASSLTGTLNKHRVQSQATAPHSTPLSCSTVSTTGNAAEIWQQGQRGTGVFLVLRRPMARIRQPPFISLKDQWKIKRRHLRCYPAVCAYLLIMGKEQDLLVAVKSGDLLLAHKLLSKIKCNKTSEYGTNISSECIVLLTTVNGRF